MVFSVPEELHDVVVRVLSQALGCHKRRIADKDLWLRLIVVHPFRKSIQCLFFSLVAGS